MLAAIASGERRPVTAVTCLADEDHDRRDGPRPGDQRHAERDDRRVPRRDDAPSARSVSRRSCRVVSPMIVKRIPPAIWNAGSVMPKTEKIAPPVSREHREDQGRREGGAERPSAGARFGPPRRHRHEDRRRFDRIDHREERREREHDELGVGRGEHGDLGRILDCLGPTVIFGAPRRYPLGRIHGGNFPDPRAFRITPPHGRHSDSRRAAAQPPEHLAATSPATSSSSSPACPARGNPRSPSTRSSPRGSGATSSRSRPTPGSSWSRWRSRTSTRSRASRRRSRSSSARRRGIPARPSAR